MGQDTFTGTVGLAPHTPGHITFAVPNYDGPILELRANGDIYVKGRLAANDIEVVDALREFIWRHKL